MQLKHIFKWDVRMTDERERKFFEMFLEKKVPYQREQWKDLEPKVGLSHMQMVSEVLCAG